MSDPDAAKLRICYHEASHAVVATLLGGWVEVVSTKAGEHYRGIVIFESFAVGGAAELLARRNGTSLLSRWGATPYALFDADERSRAERSIMICLAGHMGELLMPEFAPGGYPRRHGRRRPGAGHRHSRRSHGRAGPLASRIGTPRDPR